jgi:DHA2 family multidrug resistance protein
MGYPVITTGFVLAPRGMGTMVAMIIVGRLVERVDVRLLILGGLLLTAFSLWQMAGFSTDVGAWAIVWSGVVQGLGLGFIFVPLSTLAFATLDPRYRTEGTAMFSLMRNIGSSVGISIMVTLLAQGIQRNHAVLADNATPFNSALQMQGVSGPWSLDSTAGLAALNAEITRQAAAIAYLDDFRLMMFITLLSVPLLLLLRRPERARAA